MKKKAVFEHPSKTLTTPSGAKIVTGIPKPLVPYETAIKAAYKVVQTMHSMRVLWETGLPKETLRCSTCKNPGCCRVICLATLSEAMVVAYELAVTGRRDELQKLIEQGRQQLDFCGPEYVLGGDESKARLGEWCDRNETCVLQAEDGACTIYNYAPLVCRAYFVTNERPDVGCLDDGVPYIDFTKLIAATFPFTVEYSQYVAGGYIAPMPFGAMVEAALAMWLGEK